MRPGILSLASVPFIKRAMREQARLAQPYCGNSFIEGFVCGCIDKGLSDDAIAEMMYKTAQAIGFSNFEKIADGTAAPDAIKPINVQPSSAGLPPNSNDSPTQIGFNSLGKALVKSVVGPDKANKLINPTAETSRFDIKPVLPGGSGVNQSNYKPPFSDPNSSLPVAPLQSRPDAFEQAAAAENMANSVFEVPELRRLNTLANFTGRNLRNLTAQENRDTLTTKWDRFEAGNPDVPDQNVFSNIADKIDAVNSPTVPTNQRSSAGNPIVAVNPLHKQQPAATLTNARDAKIPTIEQVDAARKAVSKLSPNDPGYADAVAANSFSAEQEFNANKALMDNKFKDLTAQLQKGEITQADYNAKARGLFVNYRNLGYDRVFNATKLEGIDETLTPAAVKKLDADIAQNSDKYLEVAKKENFAKDPSFIAKAEKYSEQTGVSKQEAFDTVTKGYWDSLSTSDQWAIIGGASAIFLGMLAAMSGNMGAGLGLMGMGALAGGLGASGMAGNLAGMVQNFLSPGGNQAAETGEQPPQQGAAPAAEPKPGDPVAGNAGPAAPLPPAIVNGKLDLGTYSQMDPAARKQLIEANLSFKKINENLNSFAARVAASAKNVNISVSQQEYNTAVNAAVNDPGYAKRIADAAANAYNRPSVDSAKVLADLIKAPPPGAASVQPQNPVAPPATPVKQPVPTPAATKPKWTGR